MLHHETPEGHVGSGSGADDPLVVAATGLPRSLSAHRPTSRRSHFEADTGRERIAARHGGAGHRTAEGSHHEWLEPEPSWHRLDQTDDDVSRADRHGGHVEHATGV